MPSHTLAFHIAGILQLLLSEISTQGRFSYSWRRPPEGVLSSLTPPAPHTGASMEQVESEDDEGNDNPLSLIPAGTVFQRIPRHNKWTWSEALVSSSLPKYSYLLFDFCIPCILFGQKSKSGRGSLCFVYNPHAEILTSCWPLGDPDGFSFNYDKKHMNHDR